MTKRSFLTIVTAAAVAALIGQSALAQEMPGKGKTIRYAQSDSLGANYVTAQIIMRGMKALGYEVKLTTLNTTLFFQAAGQGDLDLATDVNMPQREPAFRNIEKQLDLAVKHGLLPGKPAKPIYATGYA